ncbi:MAG TPA: SRPBCC family protein, partial [Kofleriaceae bacterium]|nr:SRPBCC family protein [Kofleriaceae bacterium]
MTTSVLVGCSPERAWALLADVGRVPEWVPGVADAQVLDRDPAGRALRVRFVGMPAAGSLEWVLRYGYDDHARCLRWQSDDDDDGERSLEGEAR